MKSLVLLIDDERFPMTYYIQAIQTKGLNVEQVFDPDKALEFVEQRCDEIVAIVLDCMMPPGERYEDEDTDDGIATGVFLFKDILNACLGVPILVLTNVADPQILNQFQEDLPDDDCEVKVVQKLDYPPLELASLVKEMIANPSPSTQEDADG